MELDKKGRAPVCAPTERSCSLSPSELPRVRSAFSLGIKAGGADGLHGHQWHFPELYGMTYASGAGPSFSTCSIKSMSSSGISHFDSLVSVYV